MRLVIGIAEKSAPDSSLSIAISDDRPVIGLCELAPAGLSVTSGEASAIEVSEARSRFQESGENAVAVLAGCRAWALLGGLIKDGGAFGVLIFDDPAQYIAGRLSNGAALSAAAADWVKVSSRLLEVTDACQGQVRLFSAADIAAAPHEFSYLCESEFGVLLEVRAHATAALEQMIAAHFVAADDKIRDLALELAARCDVFGDCESRDPDLSKSALAKLRMLYKTEVETEALQKDCGLLTEQLRVTQYKAEVYYQQAYQKTSSAADSAANSAVNASEMARLSAKLAHARHEVAALRQSASWKVSAPLRWASRASRRLFDVRARLSERRQSSMLKKTDLFDAEWYLQKYPDVAALQIDPAKHFIRFGAGEGRSPSAKFDSTKYLKSNPDVAAAGINPLIHYLQVGRSEARVAGA